MEKKDNNTLIGFHVKSRIGAPLKLYPKEYVWHIPKRMRSLNIQPGDIVGANKTKARVLVTDVFREDVEDTGKAYQSISGLIKRALNRES
ncbi:MAG: DUF5839 family protein [Carnobacterium alterfunditum]